MRCRVRYFSDGFILGSREAVNQVFEEFRDAFGPRRKTCARALRGGDWQGLCSARDLRKNAISI